MNLYTLEPKFSSKTGKPIGNDTVLSNFAICDYTGQKIDGDDYEFKPMYSFEVHYDSSCEEVYDGDNKNFFNDLEIEYGSLFVSPFHFKMVDNGWDATFVLAQEWIKQVKAKKGVYSDCHTFEETMRVSRVELIKKFLSEKTYTIEELGLQLK